MMFLNKSWKKYKEIHFYAFFMYFFMALLLFCYGLVFETWSYSVALSELELEM